MNPSSEPAPAPSPDFVVGLRYSLPAMLEDIKTERVTGAYAMEKLDQQEFGKLFKPQKRRRAKPKE
jgi:hypothetical protein